MRSQGIPEKITIDQSESNTAAITRYKETDKAAIIIRHAPYLKNSVEQEHRTVKRLTRLMLGFTSFWSARCTITGIDVLYAIRKGQLAAAGTDEER